MSDIVIGVLLGFLAILGIYLMLAPASGRSIMLRAILSRVADPPPESFHAFQREVDLFQKDRKAYATAYPREIAGVRRAGSIFFVLALASFWYFFLS